MRKRYGVVMLACLLAAGNMAGAAENASAPKGKNTALEAALQACASSIAKDGQGRPDMVAMDSCMQAKGFSRPDGPPPGEGQRPAPK